MCTESLDKLRRGLWRLICIAAMAGLVGGCISLAISAVMGCTFTGDLVLIKASGDAVAYKVAEPPMAEADPPQVTEHGDGSLTYEAPHVEHPDQ